MPHPLTIPRPAILTTILLPLVAAVVLLLPGSSPTEAQTGGYLHFTGPGYGALKVEDDPALTPTEMTIEAWVYTRTGSCDSVVGKGYQSSYWLGLCGQVRIYWHDSESWDSNGGVPLDTWTHVAVTFDGTTTKFYINGVLDSETDELAGAIGLNTEPMRIGADSDWFVSPEGGAIDEVRLWSVVRTEQEILANMNTPIDTAQAGLIGSWNMEFSVDSSVGNFTVNLEGDAVFASGDVPTPLPTPTPEPTASPSPEPTASPAPGDPVRKGDINCNGEITAADALPLMYAEFGQFSIPFPCYEGVQPLSVAGAADFSRGTGYVEVPNDAALNPTDALTVEMRVYPVLYQAASIYTYTCASLFGNRDDTAGGLRIALCDGHITVTVGGADEVNSVGILPLNQVTHVAVTVDATGTKIYLNGALDSSFPEVNTLTASTNPTMIGADPLELIQPNAAIYDVLFWNVARTAEEIADDYEAGVTPPQTGLVAAWPLTSDATDAANDHDGTVQGTLEFTNLPPPYYPDIDCDGYITMLDIIPLLQYLAGLVPELPDGCLAVGSLPE